MVSIEMVLSRLEKGQWGAAKAEANRLLLCGGMNIHEQGWVEWSVGVASLYLKDVFAAVKHGERALSYAVAAQDHVLLAQSHYDVGISYVHLGDFHLAETHLNSFLSMSDRMGTKEKGMKAAARFNLARVHRSRKDYERATDELRIAISLFQDLDMQSMVARCHLDIAWGLLLAGRTDDAMPYKQLLNRYVCTHPEDDELVADSLTLDAVLHWKKGDLAGAGYYCEMVFRPDFSGVTDHHLAEVSLVMAEMTLQCGCVAEARVFSAMAESHAIRAEWSLGIGLVADLRRRLAERTVT